MAEAARSAPLRHGVEFDGISVTLAANHRPAVDWIGTYLGAYVSLAAPRTAAAGTVVAAVDERLHARMLAALERSAGEEAITHRSDSSGRARRWTWKRSRRHRPAGDMTVHVYEGDGGITVSDRRTRTCAFVSRSADCDAVHEPVRIVRELFTLELERRGGVSLHAGAVRLAGSGTVVCGPRGSGKTTLIAALLEHEGATFVANDRMFVASPPGGAPRAIAWPWGVRLGLGTCRASPALCAWLAPGRGFAYPQSDWDETALARDGGGRGEHTEVKVELTAAELGEALGAAVESSVAVDRIVIPQLDADAPDTELAAVSAEEATARLHEEVEHLSADVYTDWLDLGLASRGPLDAHARAVVASLVAAVPLMRVRYWDARDAAAAVRELVAGRASVPR